jgi:hypothetical protein
VSVVAAKVGKPVRGTREHPSSVSIGEGERLATSVGRETYPSVLGVQGTQLTGLGCDTEHAHIRGST